MKESKQGAPGSVRLSVSAGTDPAGSVGTDPAKVMNTGGGVMNTPPHARTRVVCPPCSHTEILKESLVIRRFLKNLFVVVPRARVRAYARAARRPSATGTPTSRRGAPQSSAATSTLWALPSMRRWRRSVRASQKPTAASGSLSPTRSAARRSSSSTSCRSRSSTTAAGGGTRCATPPPRFRRASTATPATAKAGLRWLSKIPLAMLESSHVHSL